MKFRLLLAVLAVALFLGVLATAVVAHGEPPPPYAGLKNPFPWSDTSAQEAGKKLYQQSCLSCHGDNGGNIAAADFSSADFPRNLQERADFYFWILSEGSLDKGMPSYKSSLSEEQRWQTLTYLRSLGAVVSTEEKPPSIPPPAKVEAATLQLTAPEQAQSGQPLIMTATLLNSQGKPFGNALVKFFIRVDFFTDALMEIGKVVTDDMGIAVFEYTPRLTGDIKVVARYEGDSLSPIETTAGLTLAKPDTPFYQAKAGISLPAPGKEVFIGPDSAIKLGEAGKAPTSALRLPGGILSWLLFIVVTVMLIWFTYFRVIYQIFRIPIVRITRGTNTRLVPLVILTIVVSLGIFLVLMLITGPYSHFQLLH